MLTLVQIHNITCMLQAMGSKFQLLHVTTAQDDYLCSVKHIMVPG